MIGIIIGSAAALIVGVIIGATIHRLQRDSANRSAEKIRSDAEKEAEHLLRDARVSAKGEVLKMREECEAELKERRKEQSNVEKRLAQRDITLELTDAAVDAIADAGFDPVYGARPLKRYMQSQLETMLARRIVAAEILPGQRVVVDAGEDGLTVRAE